MICLKGLKGLVENIFYFETWRLGDLESSRQTIF